MDLLTLAGVVVAILAIIGGNYLEGGHLDSLLQITALWIVIGGTVGAVMIQTQPAIFARALKLSVWAVRPPQRDPAALIARILGWSGTARKDGLLGLENQIEAQSDPFIQKGLQLLVDGTEPERIRRMLEVEVDTQEHRDLQCAKVYEGMGGYAPTIGILGAVLGLIHVMNNLADPSKLGEGIAVAFVATIYGVGFANLLFLPVANKLKGIIHLQVREREMLIEGFVSISEGENPRSIESKLQGFFSPAA